MTKCDKFHRAQADKLRVCVIGAGVCGLVATKICIESDFEVVCIDKSSKYGGLWQFRPEDETSPGPFEPSVMRTTILNTPKELSAFSDFPPPAKLPNFMRHDQYMAYIDSYVERFHLKEHLKLEHQVISVWPEWHSGHDERDHVRWMVRVSHVRGGGAQLLDFDRVIVAVGHHNIPFEPRYLGQEEFRGEILHSARLKDILANKRLANKRVLVVGFGNSACDAANDLSQVAAKCFVSCHRGQWFTGRQVRRGGSRWQQYLASYLPTSYNDRRHIRALESRVDHELLGLRPKHKPSELTPAINDLFPYRVLTGGIVLKGSIERFTETGVRFVGDDEECPIDVAVLATGYEARIPFLDEVGLRIRRPDCDNEYDLFLNVFAPHLRVPEAGAESQSKSNHWSNGLHSNCRPSDESRRQPDEPMRTLAFVGLVQPNGSMTVISEMQARLACLVFKDEVKLPKMEAMQRHMRKWRDMRSKTVRSHSRDQLIGCYLFYMETMAKLAGVMPNLTKLFFSDRRLWRALMFGPTVPYQYRLEGPGKWSEARQTILRTEERIRAGVNDGKNQTLQNSRIKRLQDKTASSDR